MSRASDHIVRDLTIKAGDDTSAAIERTCRLLSDPRDMFGVSLGAVGSALGLAVGFSEASSGHGATPEQLVDALWEVLRPMAIKAAGGSAEPVEKMLAELAARAKTEAGRG